MKALLLISVMAVLSACASSSMPEYVMAEEAGDIGYSESQLTDNRYRVNYNGNIRTESDEVKDMALLRAAELTLQSDQDWFWVVNSETNQETTSVRTTTEVGGEREVYRTCGLLGCTTTVSPVYSRIEVVPGRETNQYSTSIEIVMGEGEVEDPTSVYDASELYAYLSDKY